MNLDSDLTRIKAIRPRLETLFGRHFDLVPPDHFQDGTALTALVIWEPINPTHPDKESPGTTATLDFRFSNFGHLFTCLPEYAALAYPASTLREATELITREGFRFVPADSLFEPYTGQHKKFRRMTWLERYFADAL